MRVSRCLFAVAALVLGACASGPDVRVQYDKAAPFESYRTFAFASPLGTEASGYPAVSRYLTASTRRELESRGMRYDEQSPDVRVNFNAKLAQKVSGASPAPIAGGYYGYRRGSYSAWSGYPWADTAMSYTEGTLNVDVVDTRRKQLVWEGVVMGVVGEAGVTHMQESVDNAVKAAFAQYPRPR
jgi:hypothetical protein